MYQCPITYFTNNLLFCLDKSVWAVFKLTGYDYDFLADEAKIRILYRTARFLAGILSEAQILMVPVDQDIKEHFRSLVRRLDQEDPLYHNAVLHAQKTESYLEQFQRQDGAANDYRTYIMVKLEEDNGYPLLSSLRQGAQYFLKDPVNAVNVLMNLDTRDILESRLEQCIRIADKWLYEQNQKMMLSKIDTQELQWLLRRGAFRGMKHTASLNYEDQESVWQPDAVKVDLSGEEIIRPLGRDIQNLFSGSIHQGNRYLKIVHNQDRVSYQTFLALTSLPEPIEHPGCEWLYLLQQQNLQAEACIHIRAVEYHSALRKLNNKKMEIDSQMEHIAKANAEIPEDLEEGAEYANLLERELKEQNAPLLQTAITICLAAEQLEELEKKAVCVRNLYEDMNFGIERPLADQLKLYLQSIPGAGVQVKDFVMPLTPLTLASGVLGATHELGDSRGQYIGTTGREGKYVYLDMGFACLKNKSASASFYGNLGVGKSFNANLLIFLIVLYGGYGLIFDPKGERSHWAEEIAILKGLISIVTLSPDVKNKGMLDPYNMYPGCLDEADELAENIISELLRIAPASREYTAILEAQQRMRKEPVPSMMCLIRMLESFSREDELCECARFLARRLKLQAGSGMSRLLFGDGSEQAITLDNRLNILQIENLKLPDKSTAKENYTSEENLSTVLMAVAGHFAKKFALVKRPVFKGILFDESWMLGKTVEGVKLYDFLSRMGRSLYTGCIFNGHSVQDIPNEGIRNTITYKFCFQTDHDAEATRMCEYMGLEPTQENKEVLKSLGNGECLFQDLDRHVGLLRFDAVFQDIIEVFSTTPKTKEDQRQEDSRKQQTEEEEYVKEEEWTEEKESAEGEEWIEEEEFAEGKEWIEEKEFAEGEEWTEEEKFAEEEGWLKEEKFSYEKELAVEKAKAEEQEQIEEPEKVDAWESESVQAPEAHHKTGELMEELEDLHLEQENTHIELDPLFFKPEDIPEERFTFSMEDLMKREI